MKVLEFSSDKNVLKLCLGIHVENYNLRMYVYSYTVTLEYFKIHKCNRGVSRQTPMEGTVV